jgi:hypothetical protein
MMKGIEKIKDKIKKINEMPNVQAQNPNEIKVMSNSKV